MRKLVIALVVAVAVFTYIRESTASENSNTSIKAEINTSVTQ